MPNNLNELRELGRHAFGPLVEAPPVSKREKASDCIYCVQVLHAEDELTRISRTLTSEQPGRSPECRSCRPRAPRSCRRNCQAYPLTLTVPASPPPLLPPRQSQWRCAGCPRRRATGGAAVSWREAPARCSGVGVRVLLLRRALRDARFRLAG